MTIIIETENFTVNGDGSLKVTIITQFTESTEEPYIINQTLTNEKDYVNKESYKRQKETLVSEGKMEMSRATEKVESAERILIELAKIPPA